MADDKKPKADTGTAATDSVLEELEKKIKTVYRRAYNELRQSIIEFNNDYKVKSQKKIQQLQDGEITQEEYNAWEAGQAFQSKMWEEKKTHLLNVVNSANQKAIDLVNGQTQNVFATNANYIGFEIEQDVGASISFSLYDSNTMARLIKENPQLLPQKKLDSDKDKAWNNKKVVAAIQQGILQGRTIPQIAKSLSSSLAESNMKAMIRTARTAMTSAENAGRLEGMKQAEEDGVMLKKQWLSAKDARVRDTHVELNGQIADVSKPFKSSLGDIMYPGDPTAHPGNVYNCFIGNTKIASDAEIVRSYKHDYTGKLITIKTASGIEFTCTPNHPILTPIGWVAVERLNKGDNLLIASISNDGSLGVNPNVNHAFPSIEAIHELFNITGSKRTVGLGVNFHGDIPTTDVEIVTQKWFLRHSLNSSGINGINKFLLKHSDESLSSKSTFIKHFWCIWLSSLCFICGFSKTFSFFWRSVLHSVVHRFRTISGRNSAGFESQIDRVSGDMQFFREYFHGFPGKILVDNIVNINVSAVSHVPVYNLQSGNGRYFVNTTIAQSQEKNNCNFAIAHNCRCTLKYVYPQFSKAGATDYYYDKDGNKQSVTDTTFQEWIALKEQQALDEKHHGELTNQYEMASWSDVLGSMNYESFDGTLDFYHKIEEIAKKHGIDNSDVWKEYLKGGSLSFEETKELDMYIDQFNEFKKKAEEEAKKAAEEAAKKKAEEEAAKKAAEEEAKKKAEEEAAKQKAEKGLTHADVVSEYLMVDDGTGNENEMSYFDTLDMLDSFGEDTDDFKDILGEYAEANGGMNTLTGQEGAYNAYLSGKMDAETTKKIDELLLKKIDPNAKLAEPEKAASALSHDDIKDKLFGAEKLSTTIIADTKAKNPEVANDLQNTLNEIALKYGMSQGTVLSHYKYDKLSPEETAKLDELFGKAITGESSKKTENVASQATTEMVGGFSKDIVKKKIETDDVWNISSQLYANGESYETVQEWQKLLGDYFESTHYSENILTGYKNGNLDAETAKKVEEFMAKTIPNTGDPEKYVKAHEAVKGKKVTEFKKEIQSVNNKLSTDFGKELKAIGDDMGIQAKHVFEKYAEGTLPADQTKKLDDIVGAYLDKKAAGETHTVKKKGSKTETQQPTVSDEELHKTFSGIWKEDVTYADWEDKKDKIQLKKDYFEQQINAASYNGDAAKEAKFKDLLAQLEEFEKHGKEYSALLAQETATQAASAAQSGASTTSTGGGLKPLTEDEKKAAKMFKDIKAADKFHRAYLDKIWPTLTDEEKYGIWEYTRNSNPMNKSLSGYHDSWSRQNFIGMAKTEWGHEDAWRTIDTADFRKFAVGGHVSYHKAITKATKAIEKSSLPESCWLVRGSDTGGLAGLLEGDLISFDLANQLLSSKSQSSFEKLKKLIMNQDFTNHAFTSTGMAIGTGFGGDVKYKILAPKGTKAIYAEPQSYYGDTSSKKIYKPGASYSSVGYEAEVLIQRGTTYRVSDFQKKGNSYEITLEIVDQPDYFVYGDEDTYNNGRTRHKK